MRKALYTLKMMAINADYVGSLDFDDAFIYAYQGSDMQQSVAQWPDCLTQFELEHVFRLFLVAFLDWTTSSDKYTVFYAQSELDQIIFSMKSKKD